jgi:hypothetical protein
MKRFLSYFISRFVLYYKINSFFFYKLFYIPCFNDIPVIIKREIPNAGSL